NNVLREWPRAAEPRRAGVSSFGIGGTNAHVVLEEAPLRPASAPRSLELLTLSARTPGALTSTAARLADHLQGASGLALSDVADTLQKGRRAFQCRAFAVCKDREQAVASLRDINPLPHIADAADSIVFMFPGQGSQYEGMSSDLYR